MAEIISKSDTYFIGLILGSMLGASTLTFFGTGTFIGLVFLLLALTFAVKMFWYDGYEHPDPLNDIVVGCVDCGFSSIKMDIERNVVSSQTEYKVTIGCDECGNSTTIRR